MAERERGLLILVLLLASPSTAAAAPVDAITRWGAVSPAYVAAAEASLAAGSPWRPAPFCWTVGADGHPREQAPCREWKGTAAACGLQNLTAAGEWDPGVLNADPARVAREFAALTLARGCAWAILDVESLPAGARGRFVEWSRDFTRAWRLARRGGRVSVAVHAKTEEPGAWDGARAQDWAALCRAHDELLVMAYDFHFPGATGPGETAPLPWVDRVLKFARRACPPSKLRWGLAAYGYRWPTRDVITERELPGSVTASPSPSPLPADLWVETGARRREKERRAAAAGIRRYFLWALGMEPLPKK